MDIAETTNTYRLVYFINKQDDTGEFVAIVSPGTPTSQFTGYSWETVLAFELSTEARQLPVDRELRDCND